MSDIRILNVEQTLKKMAIYSDDIDRSFKGIVRDSAKSVTAKARSNVSRTVRTGRLRKSIKPKYFRKHGPQATVFPRRVPYAHFIEYGTSKRFHRSGKAVGRVKPMPYMAPAERAERPQYEREIRKLVERVVII